MENHPAGRPGARQLRQATVAAALLAIAGCAAAPAIAPAGNGSFLISRQAATGFSGLGDLRAEALREASGYCEGMKKSLEVLDTRESQPPYLMGNYPRVDIRFRCT